MKKLFAAIAALFLTLALLPSCANYPKPDTSPGYAMAAPRYYSEPVSTPRPTSKPSAIPSTPSATMGEQNALKSAKAYLNLGTGISRSGLIDQLKFEGYTDSEAEYAAKNCGADWKKEAVKCAAAYLALDIGFSKTKLIEQLEYEGFTHDQAVYGAEQNGY